MDTHQLKAGMVVECLGTRLGTLAGVGGTAAAPVLEVRPDKGRVGSGPLRIAAQHIVQVLENTVLLNISCEEAARLGQSAGQATAQLQQVATGEAAGRVEQLQGESLTVPVIDETLVPVTSWQEAGAVEIRKTVRTVTQELDVPVRYEEATVERVPVNRVLADSESLAPHQDGDTLIVPVIHEEIVVVKRRILVEELRITKQVRTTTQHVAEPVQREEVQITHQGLEANTLDPS
jgi:uncharacterized protein (TIGR02271 family)